MYAVSRLSSHVSIPSAPSFQGINHLIIYLDIGPQCPIIYPASIDVTTTHELRQEVSPGDFHSQKISNGLVDFLDCGLGLAPNENFAMCCGILCMFGVVVHC